jgi:hypothetical protein
VEGGGWRLLCTSADARLMVVRPGPLRVSQQLIGTSDNVIALQLAGAAREFLVVVDNSEHVRLHSVSDMGCVGFFLGHTDMVRALPEQIQGWDHFE